MFQKKLQDKCRVDGARERVAVIAIFRGNQSREVVNVLQGDFTADEARTARSNPVFAVDSRSDDMRWSRSRNLTCVAPAGAAVPSKIADGPPGRARGGGVY
jgi:hypothetical protein